MQADMRTNLMQLQPIKYALRTLWLIFHVLLAMSFMFGLFVSFQSKLIHSTELLIGMMVIVVPFILGWLIDKKHPGHRIALLFLIMAYSSSVTMIVDFILYYDAITDSAIPPLIWSIGLTLHHIMWIPGILFPLFLIPLYFPDGTLLSKRWRIPVMIIIADVIWTSIAITLHPWPYDLVGVPHTRMLNGIDGIEQFLDASIYFFAFLSAPLLLLVPLALFLRYRRSEGIERLQMKYPIFALIFCFTVGFSVLSIPGLSELDVQWDYPITWSLAMLFPTSIGIAIIRHNLFDIDIIINRTLVYGILTALIVALYVALVSLLGSLVEAQTTVFNGLVATGIVAVLFQPLRERLQNIVNRILYGERDNPEIVLSRLAEHMETADTPAAILPNLVETIAHTLKIPYVAIWIANEDDDLTAIAEYGKAPEKREMMSLTYHNKMLGQLVVAPRSQHEQFSQNEQKLLNTIAALTATTVRSVQLADELRHSRQRIVSAREEERRRIQRDLHDGLGPAIAAHMMQIGTARALAKTKPEMTETILVELETDVEKSLGDIRRLVYNLRPPELDQLGLIVALREFIQHCNQFNADGTTRYELHAPQNLPELPAAVEVAAYRIVQEAVNNVIRHAKAKHCSIHLSRDEMLTVRIEDNGIGIPSDVTYGVGINSMRERVEELDGTFMIHSQSHSGTEILAELPCS